MSVERRNAAKLIDTCRAEFDTDIHLGLSIGQ
jgi:hypothetical protein